MLANIQIEQITIHIVQTSWIESETDLRAIRTPVFIAEQLVAHDLEWDEVDKTAVHVMASLDKQPIACLRIIDYHKIGRMAVLKDWRSKGIGSALLFEAVKICKAHGSISLHLSAQTHAIHFYQQAGFKITSEVYQDLHIPHVDMQLDLSYLG